MSLSSHLPVNEARILVTVVVGVDKISLCCPWCSYSYDKAGNLRNHWQRVHPRQLAGSAPYPTVPQGSTNLTIPHVNDPTSLQAQDPSLPSTSYIRLPCIDDPSQNMDHLSYNNSVMLERNESTLPGRIQPQPPNPSLPQFASFFHQQPDLAITPSFRDSQGHRSEHHTLDNTHSPPQPYAMHYYSSLSNHNNPLATDGSVSSDDFLRFYHSQS
ncbi:hypothetical protein F5X96DRAFT_637362 [Biscogniauxia mediterranea]|nr:hypothetical protein F5X96DRAFT_637362 [Biscogniauxia mediterranea]